MSNVHQLPHPGGGGRVLHCKTCGGAVRVHEIPRQFLNPDTYTCGECLKGDLHLRPGDHVREETRRYDPKTAPFPY